MNTAILLSGGVGSRLPSDVPKQYIRVNGRRLITYALETLIRSTYIDEVCIVAEPEWREAILGDLRDNRIPAEKIRGFALPGKNRQGSILNGLRTILNGRTADAGDAVLIHDAARPLLSEKLLEDCFRGLPGHDGVMPVLPMKDTVYLSEDGRAVSRLLPRDKVFAGQAPEVFLLEKYYQANAALSPEKLLSVNGSTEPAVAAGMDIVMIPGEEANFKVTTPADLERFQSMAPDR